MTRQRLIGINGLQIVGSVINMFRTDGILDMDSLETVQPPIVMWTIDNYVYTKYSSS